MNSNRVEINDENLEAVNGGTMYCRKNADGSRVMQQIDINTGEVLRSWPVKDWESAKAWMNSNYFNYGDEKSIAYLLSQGWIG